MNKLKTILYIQHAGSLGGSVVSLRELVIDSLKNNYRCVVICPNQMVAKIYSDLGAHCYVSIISPWNHNTAYYYKFSPKDILRMVKVVLKTLISFIAVSRIIKIEKPAIVHLNSVTLILYLPYLRILRLPSILHVREIVATGYFGIRKKIISWLASKYSSFIIFISEYENQVLKTTKIKSFVIHNYVHLDEFLFDHSQNKIVKINPSNFTIITLGGLYRLKGAKEILEMLFNSDEKIELLVLGGKDPRIDQQELVTIEGSEYVDCIKELLNREKLKNRVRILGKANNSSNFIRAADALIFWATAPHFPRPVFEAWLLKKPVLYCNPRFESKIINAETVFNIDLQTEEEVMNTLTQIQKRDIVTDKYLERNFEMAVENFTEANFFKINELYKRALLKTIATQT